MSERDSESRLVFYATESKERNPPSALKLKEHTTMRHGVALLIVLALSSVLEAQTTAGWVLWERTLSSYKAAAAPLVQETDWEPQDGFEHLADCRVASTGAAKGRVTALKELSGAQ